MRCTFDALSFLGNTITHKKCNMSKGRTCNTFKTTSFLGDMNTWQKTMTNKGEIGVAFNIALF
jgi:hypothetical protein